MFTKELNSLSVKEQKARQQRIRRILRFKPEDIKRLNDVDLQKYHAQLQEFYMERSRVTEKTGEPTGPDFAEKTEKIFTKLHIFHQELDRRRIAFETIEQRTKREQRGFEFDPKKK